MGCARGGKFIYFPCPGGGRSTLCMRTGDKKLEAFRDTPLTDEGKPECAVRCKFNGGYTRRKRFGSVRDSWSDGIKIIGLETADRRTVFEIDFL